MTGDGRRVALLRYREAVEVSVVEPDRVEGPVVCDVLVPEAGSMVLLNNVLLGRLRIVVLDFETGLWCFRDEIGERERQSY